MKLGYLTIAIVSMTLIASGHVPLIPVPGTDIESAFEVADPLKSWAVYSDLSPGALHYYKFDMQKGDRIYLSLLGNTDPSERGFQPGLILTGPGIRDQGILPEIAEIPPGYGYLVKDLAGDSSLMYEPFGPGSYREFGEIDIIAPSSGTYYAIVFAAEGLGHYSLAVGYKESFTLLERILLPFTLLMVYMWSGQSLALILAPLAIVVAAGLYLMRRRFDCTAASCFQICGGLGGLVFLGGSATLLSQMAISYYRTPGGHEALITLVLAAIPAAMGLIAIRLSSIHSPSAKARVLMILIGFFGLQIGSGFLAGPVMVLAAGLFGGLRPNIMPGICSH